MRQLRGLRGVIGIGVAALLILAACSSSSKTTAGGGGTATTAVGAGGAIPNQRFADNNKGTPVVGGTLTMLGVGDVDYMDPNTSYYSGGYLALRMWSRSLYTYPAVTGQTTTIVPDLATAMPVITNGGKTYSITIRTGAMWNSTPPRQVTAADVVLGVKRQCNPAQPFGGQPDYSTFIAGYSDFCTGFGKVDGTKADAMKAYMDANNMSGVSVDPSNPLTVVFTLTQPVSYFTDILGLNAFDPAPVEYESYIPAGNDLAQHTLSDGPYEIQSYDPAKSIMFVRNPAWQASTDPVRKAYVDKISVSETGNQASIHQQILTNTPQADMPWDTAVPPAAIAGLVASNDPRLSLQTEFASNPYVIFNTQSPNSGGALAKVQVRQALEYAINRDHLIQNAGGPTVAPPLTQVLPPGIGGSSPIYAQYTYDTAKAKQMLAAAGYASGLTLKFLYRPASESSSKDFQTIQADLSAVGVTVTGVGVPNADFYTKYLEKPTTAKSGVWDVSLAGWSPDWYGDAAASFFFPLFDGRVLPPTSSYFGLFVDPALYPIIDAANSAATPAAAALLWHKADQEVMNQAAIFPITSDNWPMIHGSQVHNCIFLAVYQNCDPTNIWVTS
ncbi:MAG: ABC transporter substrate-binding protein [Acidimicrobiales bacterium]